jgi:hypothetical protein
MNDEENEGTHEGSNSSKHSIVMTLFSLEITLEHLWVDFCDFGEADFVGLGSSRAGGWGFCGGACKIYLKLRKGNKKLLKGDRSRGGHTSC